MPACIVCVQGFCFILFIGLRRDLKLQMLDQLGKQLNMKVHIDWPQIVTLILCLITLPFCIYIMMLYQHTLIEDYNLCLDIISPLEMS